MQSNQAEHTDLITDPIAEQAAEWVIRLSDNDLSPADHAALLAEFEQWQQVNLCHAEAASKIMTLIRQTEQLRNSVHPASARAAAEAFLSGKRSHSRLKHPGTTLLLVIALVIPAWLFFQHYPPEYMLADMRTSTGQWQSQTLTDSSTIVLSSASAVNFSFNSQQRRLELVRGDIQVDVAADPERPFQVQTV
ncbi:FecR family protein [Nitrosomonas marina]|uniref:FecR family protein n=1 Tax=Nitrosomonas marina TaxID=917 RepID=A0A1H8FKI8_9PROT|nr:FecR domain-containing protein [Nitrosomonas marina]SEN32229.1 FecR family protein [Nitrosomonas marina]